MTTTGTGIFAAALLTAAAALADAFDGAQAVWPEGLPDGMNIQTDFEASFDFPDGAQDVRLDIAAWGSYRVTLNGKFVLFGPARAAKGFFHPDRVRLDARKGRNVLRIEVNSHNVGNFYLMRQPPFLKAAVTVDGAPAAVTGKDFTARRNNGRLQRAPRYSYQRTFAEIYRMPARTGEPLALAEARGARRFIERFVPVPEFTESPFRRIQTSKVSLDTAAPDKTSAYRFLRLPGTDAPDCKGFALKDLEVNSADIALRLRYTDKRPSAPQTGDTELAAGGSALFVLDINDTGFPCAVVDVAEPGRLVLTWDEVLSENGEVRGIERYDSLNAAVWDFAAPGRYEISTFEPYVMKYLAVSALSGKMRVSRPRLREYKSPLVAGARFRASDPDLEKLFEAAKESLAQNSVDVFTDCPGRERAGWNCDAYFESAASALLTGGTDQERAFESLFALADGFDAIPDGMLPMCYPADTMPDGYIPNWAMWFVIETDAYLGRSGDRKTAEALRPKFERLVAFFRRMRNSDGLLERLPGWVFVEWSRANALVQDVNYPSNMLWAGMLDAMSRLYGDESYAEEARAVRAKIREQSFRDGWFCDNAVRGADGKLALSGERTETCQYYAFFFGVATKESHPELHARLFTEFGPKRRRTKAYPEIHFSNAFIGNYLRLMILARENRGQQMLDESKGFFLKMADSTGTLWEHDDTRASCNHGFAAYLSVFLVENVLGVAKIDREKRKVTVRDTDVALEWCAAKLPTSDGAMTIGWTLENGIRKWTFDLPPRWTAVVRSE